MMFVFEETTPMNAPRPADRLDEVQFTLAAIEKLRSGDYLGIHTVFSGFNAAFREYFGTDPVAATKVLAELEVIAIHPAKGGAIIYRFADMPLWLKKQRLLLKSSKRPKKATPLDRILGG
jgi:hypothetical protein